MDSINYQIAKYAVFIDTNVLYSAYVRDLILRLALADTFRVHWSPDVMAELRKRLAEKANLQPEALDRLENTMNTAFPAALITDYHDILPYLSYPTLPTPTSSQKPCAEDVM